MEKENITLSLPIETLRKAKLLAAKRNISLSNLLSQALEDMIAKENAYEMARERQLARMGHGADLGTEGKITWTRDELHER